jgi:prefoldin subunit 5
MTAVPPTHEGLARENKYLRERNAQLQNDIADLAADAHRLRQELERLHGRSARVPPNPSAGGQ